MSFLKSDLAFLGLFGVIVFSFTDCSLLTKVDWTAIPPQGAGGTGGEAGDHGEAGSAAAGEEAGAGGVAEGGAGGEGGESGEGGNPDETGGRGGFGGGGGNAGKGGTGGTAGGGGMPAIGGSGPANHPTCSDPPTTGLVTPSSIGAKTALVLFDGGTGTNGNRGGRVGLDAVCAAAKTKLQLQQSETHAVISVGLTDQIFDMPENYGVPRKSVPVLSAVGVRMADDWNSLWKIPGTVPSLVCAGVMPPNSLQWLTGTNNKKIPDPTDTNSTGLFGLWDYVDDMAGARYDNSCNGWTLPTLDAANQARIGSTIAHRDGGDDGFPRLISYLVVSCAKATGNILCIAYDKVE